MIWRRKGKRVRVYHRRIRWLTYSAFLLPWLGLDGYYIYTQFPNLEFRTIPIAITSTAILLNGLLTSGLLNHFAYKKLLAFSRLNNLRILANYLIENGYYLSKKVKNREKIRLPKVYLRQSKFGLALSFILEGNKFQDKFLTLGNTLEIMYDGDFTGKKFSKGYVTYEIAVDQFAGRLKLEQVALETGALRLMSDVTWNFVKQPHLLIGGGTGGGKTVLLMTLLYGLAPHAYIDICDPKQSDLSSFMDCPVFKGRIYNTRDAIINCLKENMEMMEARYRYMQAQDDYQAGMNFASFGLRPKFIVIDEWAAFMAKLEGDYRAQQDAVQALTVLILEARQAGIFIIMAMQRPDGEFIKTSLRDQFMKRLSVGHLEDTGYTMMFGDANKNKEFKYVDKIDGKEIHGRGYIANGGEIAQEFFSPLVDFEGGFSFKEAFMKMKVLEEQDLTTKEDKEETMVEPEPIPPKVEIKAEDLPRPEPKEVIHDIHAIPKTIKEFADQSGIPPRSLKKIITLLEEQGQEFDKQKGSAVISEAQGDTILKIAQLYNNGAGSYQKAVEQIFDII